MNQRERAEIFHRLHAGPQALRLPNIWDVISARVVEQAGFPALATSSAAVAWALGHPDGEHISREEMAAAGYGPRPEDVAAMADIGLTQDINALLGGDCG